MSLIHASILNSKFEIDSEYTKISDFFTTWLEGHGGPIEGNPDTYHLDIDVLKGMENPEIAIEGIVQYMNIAKGIRQDIVPYPLKEIINDEKGMRAYVCKLRLRGVPSRETQGLSLNQVDLFPEGKRNPGGVIVMHHTIKHEYQEDETQAVEEDNFEIADFIDNYVEKNGMTGLYEMMGYSNFLGIKPLLYLCCAKMALMMKDKSLEEIKTLVESGL